MTRKLGALRGSQVTGVIRQRHNDGNTFFPSLNDVCNALGQQHKRTAERAGMRIGRSSRVFPDPAAQASRPGEPRGLSDDETYDSSRRRCGALDLWGALRLAYLPIFVAIALADLFDSLSTFIGIAQAAGLTDEKGEPFRLGPALLVDALATFVAGLLGTSASTAYIESVAGIRAGGRTGRVAVVAGLGFLPFLFLGLLRFVPMFRGAATLATDASSDSLTCKNATDTTTALVPLIVSP